MPWLWPACALEEVCKLAQERLPLRPVLSRRVETVLHVAEELDLHDVNLVHVDSRYLGPGLVGVGIVVEKFVAEHQCHREQSILAARLPSNLRIQLLQPVNEEQRQKHHILSHQCRREYCRDPFSEASRGFRICIQKSRWDERSSRLFDLLKEV